MTEPTDPNFDWVNARNDCTAANMLARLKTMARDNVAERNRQLGAHQESFGFEDDGPQGFRAWDKASGSHKRIAVDVTLSADRKRIEVSQDGRTAPRGEFAALITLNSQGICVFEVDGEELLAWQVLKRALEPLLFG